MIEELRSVRASSPRATIGEAGTFWDSDRPMTPEEMCANAHALIENHDEAVYLMREIGGQVWRWFCGLLSVIREGEKINYQVTLSNKTCILPGVYKHSGADETYDFPHPGYEYSQIVSKDVYWEKYLLKKELETWEEEIYIVTRRRRSRNFV
eukprot:TRINITY_DN3696_c0_g2_i8.p1 TRINITY_DN3696_c0_g2~~TRINITY_DN3696_c0_g2_i8.p1  ORF type:complete len:152 (-),score=10.19 TRINITY_DN3696_c0_g2_i8:215-670(-)